MNLIKWKIIGVLLLLATAFPSSAQYINRLYDWDTTSDWGWNIVLQPDNNCFIQGSGINPLTGIWGAFNMVRSADGNVVLTHKEIKLDSTSIGLGDPGQMTRLATGGYVVPLTIQKNVGGGLRSSGGVMKYNSAGDSVFLKTYTDTSIFYDFMNCSAELVDGGYVVGGERGKNEPGKYPGLVMRFNGMGDTLWTKTIRQDTNMWVEVHSVLPISGNRILVGAQNSRWVYAWTTYSHNAPWFLILDGDGNVIKDTMYGGRYGGGGRIYKDMLGGYIHYGELDSLATSHPEDLENIPFYIAHLDTNLRMQWITRLTYNEADGKRYIEKLLQLHDGSILAIGESIQYGGTNIKAWAAKLSHDGTIVWQRNYDSDHGYDAYFRDAAEKPDGSIIIVGATYNDTVPTWHPNRDLWLLGIDANGCETMSCALGVEQTVGQSASGSVQLYPNPTTGVFSVKAGENGTLIVYTMDGRKVTSYIIGKGANDLVLPKELAAGMYMCRYTGESGTNTMVRLVVE